MKQYTTPEQTAKLIELGLPKPKNRIVKQRFDRSTSSWIVVGEEGAYSIGELIEMLPKKIEMSDDETGELEVSFGNLCMVYYTSFGVIYYDTEATELIDALYDMIIKIKEEGVI